MIARMMSAVSAVNTRRLAWVHERSRGFWERYQVAARRAAVAGV
jgi:hypothetical protein